MSPSSFKNNSRFHATLVMSVDILIDHLNIIDEQITEVVLKSLHQLASSNNFFRLNCHISTLKILATESLPSLLKLSSISMKLLPTLLELLTHLVSEAVSLPESSAASTSLAMCLSDAYIQLEDSETRGLVISCASILIAKRLIALPIVYDTIRNLLGLASKDCHQFLPECIHLALCLVEHFDWAGLSASINNPMEHQHWSNSVTCQFGQNIIAFACHCLRIFLVDDENEEMDQQEDLDGICDLSIQLAVQCYEHSPVELVEPLLTILDHTDFVLQCLCSDQREQPGCTQLMAIVLQRTITFEMTKVNQLLSELEIETEIPMIKLESIIRRINSIGRETIDEIIAKTFDLGSVELILALLASVGPKNLLEAPELINLLHLGFRRYLWLLEQSNNHFDVNSIEILFVCSICCQMSFLMDENSGFLISCNLFQDFDRVLGTLTNQQSNYLFIQAACLLWLLLAAKSQANITIRAERAIIRVLSLIPGSNGCTKWAASINSCFSTASLLSEIGADTLLKVSFDTSYQLSTWTNFLSGVFSENSCSENLKISCTRLVFQQLSSFSMMIHSEPTPGFIHLAAVCICDSQLVAAQFLKEQDRLVLAAIITRLCNMARPPEDHTPDAESLEIWLGVLNLVNALLLIYSTDLSDEHTKIALAMGSSQSLLRGLLYTITQLEENTSHLCFYAGLVTITNLFRATVAPHSHPSLKSLLIKNLLGPIVAHIGGSPCCCRRCCSISSLDDFDSLKANCNHHKYCIASMLSSTIIGSSASSIQAQTIGKITENFTSVVILSNSLKVLDESDPKVKKALQCLATAVFCRTGQVHPELFNSDVNDPWQLLLFDTQKHDSHYSQENIHIKGRPLFRHGLVIPNNLLV